MSSLLLIDIGNSRAKWARLTDGRMGRQHAASIDAWTVDDYVKRLLQPAGASRIVVSSVAGAGINRQLIDAARRSTSPAPEFVTSQRRAGGITTRYLEPWRLGVDRFVGAIGAYHLADGGAVCVVSIGTAMTLDLVDSSGHHRGGAILPGPVLMVESLLSSTSGIRRRAGGGPPGKRTLFAQTTRTAIQQGTLHAAAAVIDRAIEEASHELGSGELLRKESTGRGRPTGAGRPPPQGRPAGKGRTPPQGRLPRSWQAPLVVLTGGGAPMVKPLIRSPHVEVPHLVLHGLAVWARVTPLGRPVN
ncbi:MAG TPA: type III pantothenate kinase [Steroidobacteraceae bacterium]